MKHKTLIPLNLQFFADDSGAAEGSTDESSSSSEGKATGDQDQPKPNDQGNGESSGGKTFTQAELSAVAATEKKQGKQSIMNLFGVKNEKEAKEQAEAFKKWQESQKDTEQKLKDSEVERQEATSRALAAENKLTLIMAGVNKDSLDDALAIASLKVTEDKDLTAVLEDMKKEPKYKGFFSGNDSSSSSNGTGNPAGHQGSASGGSKENIGERLAKAKSKKPEKSKFFTN